MDTINWGIIGAGDVAEVKSGPAFNKVKNSKLLAVMRRNTAKAKDFAERHHVPFWYDSIDDLLANKDINAVYIATPPSTHLEIAKKCLAAKKRIYLEKPMTLNATEAKELNKIVTENDTIVVAHYRRINFKNGVQFRGIWNFNANKRETKDECKIYGTKGTITFSFYGEKVMLSSDEKSEVFNFTNPKNIQEPMIEATVNYFLKKTKNPCTIKEGLEVMKVIDSFIG